MEKWMCRNGTLKILLLKSINSVVGKIDFLNFENWAYMTPVTNQEILDFLVTSTFCFSSNILHFRQEVLLLGNEIAFNEAIIEERDQGIREIQDQIGEASEIFKDLAVLVHDQGVVIGKISDTC